VTTRRGEAYRSFFQRLIDELRERHNFTNARVSLPRNFYHFASGDAPRVYYDAFFNADGRAVASVLIRRDREESRRLFDWLERDRAKIESEFGAKLNWSKPDDVRACSISTSRPGSIEDERATLQDIHLWFTDNLLNLKKVFGPRLLAYNSAKP